MSPAGATMSVNGGFWPSRSTGYPIYDEVEEHASWRACLELPEVQEPLLTLSCRREHTSESMPSPTYFFAEESMGKMIKAVPFHCPAYPDDPSHSHCVWNPLYDHEHTQNAANARTLALIPLYPFGCLPDPHHSGPHQALMLAPIPPGVEPSAYHPTQRASAEWQNGGIRGGWSRRTYHLVRATFNQEQSSAGDIPAAVELPAVSAPASMTPTALPTKGSGSLTRCAGARREDLMGGALNLTAPGASPRPLPRLVTRSPLPHVGYQHPPPTNISFPPASRQGLAPAGLVSPVSPWVSESISPASAGGSDAFSSSPRSTFSRRSTDAQTQTDHSGDIPSPGPPNEHTDNVFGEDESEDESRRSRRMIRRKSSRRSSRTSRSSSRWRFRLY